MSELRLEDLEGWEQSPACSGGLRFACGRLITATVDRGTVELLDRGYRVTSEVPLAVLVNQLRLAGWTVLPPGLISAEARECEL